MSPDNPEHIAIVGAGILGLATAYQLTESGYKVTIVARNIPGDADSTNWASPWAGALLAPHPDISYPELQLSSLRFYQELADTVPESSVQNVKITELYNDRPSIFSPWYKPHMTNFSFLSSSELPPNVNVGYTYTGLILNPPQFLPWMVQQLNTRNVNFIRKTLTSLSEARDLTGARLIVNASGLGARELVSDAKVQGVRGQTMLVSCPPGSPLFKHAIILQGSEYTYIIPRPGNGQIVLGGVSQYGDQRTRADESLRGDILGRVNKLTDEAFGWVDLKNGVRDVVGFRPGREGGLRVEREGQVVHAYGAASWGYVYAFGVAGKVEELTREGLAGQSAKL